MSEPKVGIISFGDERDDMWEKVFRDLAVPRHQLAHEYFSELPVEFHGNKEVARSMAQINDQIDELSAKKVDVLIVMFQGVTIVQKNILKECLVEDLINYY